MPDDRDPSGIRAAAFLTEPAEVGTLSHRCAQMAQDVVRGRYMEEEVRQHELEDVVRAAEPPACDRRIELEGVRFGPASSSGVKPSRNRMVSASLALNDAWSRDMVRGCGTSFSK